MPLMRRPGAIDAPIVSIISVIVLGFWLKPILSPVLSFNDRPGVAGNVNQEAVQVGRANRGKFRVKRNLFRVMSVKGLNSEP